MLNKKQYFIKEHVGFMKLADTFDILDPETQEHVATAQEKPGALFLALRLLLNKKLLPTTVKVYAGDNTENENQILFSMKRGFSLFTSKVEVINRESEVIGWFKSKFFSFGGAFKVFAANGAEIALVKGDWKGWNFTFLDLNQNELGRVTKKWAGIGKEMFTSADNYMISLEGNPEPSQMMLLIAAGLAIDIVYKEK